MQPGGSSFQNDLYSNMPNASLAFTMWSNTFGNMNMVITPPASMIPGKPDQVQAGFPSLPYLSLEALLYQQQSSNPVVAPPNILTGNTAGSQNINGQQTITNGAGQQVYTAGYSANGF
jgi:hypothetical protein